MIICLKSVFAARLYLFSQLFCLESSDSIMYWEENMLWFLTFYNAHYSLQKLLSHNAIHTRCETFALHLDSVLRKFKWSNCRNNFWVEEGNGIDQQKIWIRKRFFKIWFEIALKLQLVDFSQCSLHIMKKIDVKRF